MRLIEVDVLKEKLDKIPARSIENADGRAYALIRLSTVYEIIKQLPAAQSFNKGLWVKQELAPQTLRFCSLCGYKKPRGITNYCPNCGADMRSNKA